MIHIGNTLLGWFVCRPWRLLWTLPLLVAFESPGCVLSERPLTRFDEDSIDDALIGEWTAPDDTDNSLALWIGVRDAKTMEVRFYDTEDEFIVLAGYISRLGDETYANLQFVDMDCVDCSDDERSDVKAEFQDEFAELLPDNPESVCTWMIVRYVLGDDGTLRVFWANADTLVEDIAAGRMAGQYDPDRATGGDEDVCVTASAGRLQRYLTERSPDVFRSEDAEDFVRRAVVDRRPSPASGD